MWGWGGAAIVFIGAKCASLVIALLSFVVPAVRLSPPQINYKFNSFVFPALCYPPCLFVGICLLALSFDVLVPLLSAPPSLPASSGLQVGWWCCDMVSAVVWCSCCCLEMEPVPTLQAEACSSGIEHGAWRGHGCDAGDVIGKQKETREEKVTKRKENK
jgi:hypothetical protein